MANPVDYEEKSADLDVVTLHVEFVVGASGAVASVTRGREFLPGGTAAVVKQSGAGTYRLMLKEQWVALLGNSISVLQATYDKTHGCLGDVSSNQAAASGKYVEITLRSSDGNASLANAASGDIVRVTLEMQKTKP